MVLLGRNGRQERCHTVCDLIDKKAGQVTFKGRDIAALDPRSIVRAGIVNVLEGTASSPAQHRDNLPVGTLRARARATAQARRVCNSSRMAERRHQLASRLSGGQQQIPRSQGIIADPELQILDEPSGGLAPIVIDRILQVATQLCESGISILLVEQ